MKDLEPKIIDLKIYLSLKLKKMKYEFEKKWPDKFNPMRFNINYWFLKKIGLNGFGFFSFVIGALITVLIYEFLIN